MGMRTTGGGHATHTTPFFPAHILKNKATSSFMTYVVHYDGRATGSLPTHMRHTRELANTLRPQMTCECTSILFFWREGSAARRQAHYNNCKHAWLYDVRASTHTIKTKPQAFEHPCNRVSQGPLVSQAPADGSSCGTCANPGNAPGRDASTISCAY